MAKRRGNSEGTVYFHGPSGRWTGQATVGRDPVSGKARRVTVYGDTQREALQRLQEAKGRPPEGSDMKVRVALNFWLGAHKTRVDAATALRYAQESRPLLEHLGDLPLSRVSQMHLADMVRRMEAAGVGRDKQRRAVARAKQFFGALLRRGLISADPSVNEGLPRVERKKIRPLSAEEARRLLEAARGGRHEALFRLALDSGARSGELFALTWADLDLAAREVYFSRSLQESKGRLRVKDPKTKTGRRRVPVTEATAGCLVRSRPEGAGRGDLVFPDEAGGFLRRSNFRKRAWLPVQARAGLAGVRFHDLRHTCATLLLIANVHPKVVQERLGHASIEITLNTYSHFVPAMQTSAVAALEAALGDQPQ